MTALIFATRPSRLARWQTRHVIEQLQAAWEDLVCEEVVITTRGDRILDRPLPEIGGKGLFTHELEQALRSGRVHAAVHSLKDLPTESPSGLAVEVIPERADARDALVCPAGLSLDDLPPGAVVGTSSVRRQAQLLARRPDLQVASLRGNVDTRVRKVEEGQYDAIVLAAAGLQRLGLEDRVTEVLPLDVMLPAPGQGALAVQCRSEDAATLRRLAAIDHAPSRLAATAERSFLNYLGGGCSLPVGAFATVEGREIVLQGVVVSAQGAGAIRLEGRGEDPLALGAAMARRALDRGAGRLLPVEARPAPVERPSSHSP